MVQEKNVFDLYVVMCKKNIMYENLCFYDLVNDYASMEYYQCQIDNMNRWATSARYICPQTVVKLEKAIDI